ncbi:MAG: hypothetical protein Q8K99_05295 [Actinomycetota bacterium]|nr:hypothetical protein [Actinomycetota bacterium]
MQERLFVVSSDAGEAERVARPLRDRGWHVEMECQDPQAAQQRIADCMPMAVVISLGFGVQSGCDLACALQVGAATKDLPVIFVGGDHESVELARKTVPHAVFLTPAEIPWAIKRLTFKQ